MNRFEAILPIAVASILLTFPGSYNRQVNADNSLTSLPKTLMPTLYNLSLVLDPEIDGYIGTVNITFDVLDNETVKDIYLNVDPNYIYIEEVMINNMIRPRLGTPNEENILDVNFTLGISGKDNSIFISFIGKYSEDYGLVQVNYTLGDVEQFKVESHFGKGYAARAFPCMDEADLPANFSLVVEHPYNYTALATTEMVDEDCTTSETITTYAVTDKISPDDLYINVEILPDYSTCSSEETTIIDSTTTDDTSTTEETSEPTIEPTTDEPSTTTESSSETIILSQIITAFCILVLII